MKRRIHRQALALLAVTAICAAGALQASAARTSGKTAATPACATSGLVVWLYDTPGGGAAGSIYYELKLTNLSGHICVLSGYPGVSGVDLAGHRIGAPARREPGQTPHPVTLAVGASAGAVLRITEAGDYSAGSCSEVTAAGLRVYPPGQTRSRVVPFPFQTCSRSGPAILSVRAVRGS